MSQYYYLDDRREPHGPHSLDELSTMMAAGQLTPMTLVACIGGKDWQPLGTVLSQENLPPVPSSLDGTAGSPSTPPATPELIGCCPSCGVMLQPTAEGSMPPACTHCRREFLPKTPGIWSNFCLSLSNYAKFSGRSTRAEFWSFMLITYFLYFFFTCLMVAGFATYFPIIRDVVQDIGFDQLVSIPDAEAEQLVRQGIDAQGGLPDPSGASLALILGGVFGLLATSLAFFIPSLSVTFRRLHDRGMSGWVLGGYLILNWVSGILLELSDREPDFGPMTAFGLLTYLLSWAYLIYIIIVCATDSQRGLNKFGPSAKYPLG